MSTSHIKCPNCGVEINIDEVLQHSLEEKIRIEFQEKYQRDLVSLHSERDKIQDEKKRWEEYKSKESEIFYKKLNEEKKEIEKQIKASQEEMMRDLQKKVQDAELDKLKFQKLELEMNTLSEKLRNEHQLELTKKEIELRNILSEQIRKDEEAKSDIKIRELEHKLDQQKKSTEEMQRKLHQGSMETQGEVVEEIIEQKLRMTFPYDEIVEIKKGEIGADILLNVKSERIGYCGSIIYECKNTKTWSNDWIEKLKSDQKAKNAFIAILVTKAFPKDYERFTNMQGIWVCSLSEFLSLTEVMRTQIIRLKEIEISQQNKGDKVVELYDYLQSENFRNAMMEIADSFLKMKADIDKERIAMEKHWKLREIQLEKMITNTLSVTSRIQSIGGSEILELPMLEI